MQTPRFIVGEVSKSWKNGEPCNNNVLLSQRFEAVIKTNLERGYELHSWRLSQVMTPNGLLSETIVAVFELLD